MRSRRKRGVYRSLNRLNFSNLDPVLQSNLLRLPPTLLLGLPHPETTNSTSTSHLNRRNTVDQFCKFEIFLSQLSNSLRLQHSFIPVSLPRTTASLSHLPRQTVAPRPEDQTWANEGRVVTIPLRWIKAASLSAAVMLYRLRSANLLLLREVPQEIREGTFRLQRK